MTPERTRQARLSGALVLLLALASVALVAYSVLEDLDRQQRLTVFYVDCGICALFLAEFLWSWRRAGWGGRFVLRNWYDLLSMIPVAHPTFTEGGWTTVLWVVVVGARVGRAADQLVGARVTAALTRRATASLVSAVRQPITVAVLDDVAEVLQTGHYTRNLAAALQENQEHLKAMIREKLEEDRLTGRLSLVPFHDNLIDTISDTTLRVVFAVLADPRTDELVADLLRENVEQLREQIRAKSYGSGQGESSVLRPDDVRERDDIPALQPRRPTL